MRRDYAGPQRRPRGSHQPVVQGLLPTRHIPQALISDRPFYEGIKIWFLELDNRVKENLLLQAKDRGVVERKERLAYSRRIGPARMSSWTENELLTKLLGRGLRTAGRQPPATGGPTGGRGGGVVPEGEEESNDDASNEENEQQ